MLSGDIVDVVVGNPLSNTLGGPLTVAVNGIANSFTRYYREPAIQATLGVYPGDLRCRLAAYPHSKWHENAANGLIDVVYLGRDIDLVLRGQYWTAGSSPLGRSDINRITFGCSVNEDMSSTDEAMAEFLDCIVSSTPGFACIESCVVEQPSTLSVCLLDCLSNGVV